MYEQIQEICDKKKWDSFVLKTSPPSLFQSWDWGEVQKESGFELFRFGIVCGGKIFACVQYSVIRARRGSYYHLRHGPVVNIINGKEWQNYFWKLIDFIKNRGVKDKIWFLRISPLIRENPEVLSFIHSKGFQPSMIHAMDAEYCWNLNINKNEEELLSEMRKTTRYEIRKSLNMKIIINTELNKKNKEAFFALYQKTYLRHGFVGHKGIEEEIEIFAKSGNIRFYLASYDGKPLAGALILYWGDQAIYHHGASIPSKIPASTSIQWQAILDAKSANKKIYNFWGIAPEGIKNHPWSGITLFKKGFGGYAESYLHAQDLPISSKYMLTRGIDYLWKKRKGYS